MSSLIAKKVYLIYYSKEGHTRSIADQIYEIFKHFSPPICELQRIDATKLNYNVLRDASGYILGSPDYFGYPSGYIKLLYDNLYESRHTIRGRPVFHFISHGGGGRALKAMEDLSGALKLYVITPGISALNGKLSKEDLALIQKNCQILLNILE